MKTTIEFIDAVKTKRGITSDYQLAQLLGISRAAISKYRRRNDFLGEEMACKIASILEIESGYVLACIAAERSKMPEAKKAWEWMVNHLGGLAAALALVVFLPTVALDSSHFNTALNGANAPDSVYYVKRSVVLLSPLFYSGD